MENNKDAKILVAMALIKKTMEQINSIMKEDDNTRYRNWNNNLYTVSEDMQDELTESANK